MVNLGDLMRAMEEREQAAHPAHPAQVAAPLEQVRAAEVAPLEQPPPLEDHRRTLRELHREVESLRRLQERAVVLGWAVLAAIGVALLVCLVACMQSSRQLAHATAMLAYSCEWRRPPGMRFPPS